MKAAPQWVPCLLARTLKVVLWRGRRGPLVGSQTDAYGTPQRDARSPGHRRSKAAGGRGRQSWALHEEPCLHTREST